LQGELLPEAQLKLWLAQALLAMVCLQGHCVLHRDLKTANLYLSDDNDLLIGDFGLAVVRRGEAGEDQSVVGTCDSTPALCRQCRVPAEFLLSGMACLHMLLCAPLRVNNAAPSFWGP
jgi:serine/threonine protein kinase